MVYKIFYIIFLLVISIIQNVSAQAEHEKFSFVDIKNGISKKPISAITQDKNGFTWIGTNGAGLYKFDGTNYTIYNYDWNKESSINSNYIYCTYIDSKNRLWIGTNVGLNLYSKESDTFERINLKSVIDSNTTNIDIKCLEQDANGNLLIGTNGHGLLKMSLDNFRVSTIKTNEPDESTLNIYVLRKNIHGEIFVGTNRGLKILDTNNSELTPSIPISNYIPNYDGKSILSLTFDKDDNLWVGTTLNGLIKISKSNSSYKMSSFPVSDKRILSIMALDSIILVGTENDGLLVVDLEGNIINKYIHDVYNKNGVSSNSIWSLYLDKQERIWVGYFDSGIGIYDKLYNKFQSIESVIGNENSLQASSITSIKKDGQGRLWMSTGDGVDIFNPVTKELKRINGDRGSYYQGLHKTPSLQAVFIDSSENIWLGSWSKGIYFLKKGSTQFVNYNINNTNGALTSNSIRSFSEDSKGRIWIATFLEGLHYYDPIKNVFIHCNSDPFIKNGLINSDVKVVVVDSEDNIWMGTTNGLFKINYVNEDTILVESMRNKMPKKLKNHPSIHQILSIYEAKNKRLWIGTNGGGLFSYNSKEGVFISYNDFEGFDQTIVNAIIEEKDGSIWISGKSGITNIDLEAKKMTNYNVDDGLLGNYFNNNSAYSNEKGVLYFGGYSGVNYFNTDEITTNKVELSLYFTDFKLFNKKVRVNDDKSPLKKAISETKSITLTHDQSVFTIEYVGVNYTRAEKNQYAYYIEGVDQDWNYVGNVRSATYTNLAQGDYIFKVKSANNDGIWNETPLELKIKILPPWWKTNMAYFIYFVLLASSFYLVNVFLRKRFKEKQILEFERNKRVQEEKLNNKKLEFFTNISHEFRTPLTLIMNPLIDIIEDKKLDLPKVVKEKHRTIYKNSDRLSRLINELMDFRKLQSNKIQIQAQEIDAIKQVKDILVYFREEALHRKIALTFKSEIPKLISWIDISMLEKILFNIISNAFKVTPNGGNITVFVKEGQAIFPLINSRERLDSFEISVRDTGTGLDQKEYKKIFKRFYHVSKSNKSYYGSTGIGLEVVKDFIELHKGIIDLESKIGEGTKFILIFPYGKKHFSEDEILNSENAQIPHHKEWVNIHGIELLEDEDLSEKDKEHTLLIVEDNLELRNYLKNELKKNYSIIVAENGQKGLELAREKLPDIIITDVVMPIMNGLELCENIKSDIKTSHIPLLMLTSKAMVEDKIKGIDSGADIYLSKPFNMGILKSSLAQLLTSRQILFNKYYNGIAESTEEKTTTIDNEFIKKILNHIHENISDPDLNVELLASEFFLSRSQLYRKIKGLTGISANKFIRKVRLEKAKEILESSNHFNVSEVTYKIGFSSPSYFTKCFKAEFGYLPKKRAIEQ